jgi:hypothetical protein
MTQTKSFNFFFYAYLLQFSFPRTRKKRMSDLILTFIPLKIFDLLYSWVGAGARAAGVAAAGAASKFSSGAGAA